LRNEANFPEEALVSIRLNCRELRRADRWKWIGFVWPDWLSSAGGV
jgi:hypothetical protein